MNTFPLIRALYFSLFLTIQTYDTEASAVLIHDVAFSPDGRYIGIGTNEGFQLLDWENRNVAYRFSVPDGVKFLKWSRDFNRVLIASWQEPALPTYSLLDIRENRALFSFQEEVRWYYHHTFPRNMYGEIREGFTYLIEKAYPDTTQLGHPNSITFSFDNQKMAYITQAGSIFVRNMNTGELLRELALPDHHATSLGYTPDGQQMWVGIIVRNELSLKDHTRLLYLNSANGEILDQLKFRLLTFGEEDYPFWVYDVRPDRKYTLAVSSDNSYEYTTIQHYLIDVEKAVVVQAVSGGTDFGRDPKPHAAFIGQQEIFGLNDNGDAMGINRYDYHNLTNVLYPHYYPVPAQPFAPDGGQFLMIDNDRLYVVNSTTLERREFSLQPVRVEDYPQHEPVKD